MQKEATNGNVRRYCPMKKQVMSIIIVLAMVLTLLPM